MDTALIRVLEFLFLGGVLLNILNTGLENLAGQVVVTRAVWQACVLWNWILDSQDRNNYMVAGGLLQVLSISWLFGCNLRNCCPAFPHVKSCLHSGDSYMDGQALQSMFLSGVQVVLMGYTVCILLGDCEG
jgi:hypothetical protein